MQVLAHSLDEHKRLTAAKQNQEHLLAEHFSKVNIADPSGEAFESDSFQVPFEDQDAITIEDEPVLESEINKNNRESLKELEGNDENIQQNDIEHFRKHDVETIDHVGKEYTASQEVAEILENSLIDSDEKTLLISSPAKCTYRKPKGLLWMTCPCYTLCPCCPRVPHTFTQLSFHHIILIIFPFLPM